MLLLWVLLVVHLQLLLSHHELLLRVHDAHLLLLVAFVALERFVCIICCLFEIAACDATPAPRTSKATVEWCKTPDPAAAAFKLEWFQGDGMHFAMEKDFEINSFIVLSDPQNCCARKMLMRKGCLHFDSAKQSFSATVQNKIILHLLPDNLCKIRKEECPNGRCYIIRYKKTQNESAKELILKEISEPDKKRLHFLLLGVVGMEREIVPRKARAEGKSGILDVPPSMSSTILSDVPLKVSKSFYGPSIAKMAQGKSKVELGNVLRKSVADDKKLDFDVTPSTSAPAEHRNVLEESAADDKKPLLTVVQPSFSFVTTRRGVKRLFLSDSISPVENKENIEKRHSSADISDILNNNDNKELLEVSRPDQEMELPDHFIRSNFWSELRSDKRLRSGKSGEWVKGQDERLTIDGLLCLSDGEWLNADIIDSYLDHLCQQSAGMAQFIPTYAILSYERKGTVPSEWYWRLNGTDIVFAPAHLYTNHWAMVVVNIRERKLTLMDSMNHEFTSSDKTIFMDTIM
ncbi:hypothetical protein GPALN_003697 [Globodera pallida]|nr:hypothetical protein GPALN_003697 [Globodera pallida]